MKRPRICAVIVSKDLDAIRAIEPLVELFEVRIDLIGDGWQELAKQLNHPWIATLRTASEGGKARDGGWETGVLHRAIDLGASIVDIQLRTSYPKDDIRYIKTFKKTTECLVSFHDMEQTLPLPDLKRIVEAQLAAGADICKVITTAQRFEDNLTVLQLIAEFPQTKIISFAMGPLGLASRILCPLVGGDFTYASIEKGKESAPGQLTVRELRKIYEMVMR